MIEEDLPEIGAYLYVYERDICVKDYLQNSVEACKRIALRDYDVPLSKWKSVSNTPDTEKRELARSAPSMGINY